MDTLVEALQLKGYVLADTKAHILLFLYKNHHFQKQVAT